MPRACLPTLTVLLLRAGPIVAQQPMTVGSELDRYARALEVAGRLHGAASMFRPVSYRHIGTALRADSTHPWSSRYPLAGAERPKGVSVTVIDPAVRAVYQSAYPRSVNDGAVWTGKGLTGALRAGAVATWGPVTATLHPTLFSAANDSFPTAPVTDSQRSPYAYAWRSTIDWPQRFGPDAVTEADWGDSGLRLDLSGFTLGLTTENMWWGPAQRHSILMSNTAPGFPHLDLGTGRPVSAGIGQLEARLVWGRLRESNYFDMDPSNDRRFFTGATVAFRLRWTPGLTLGVGRAFVLPWDSVDFEDGVVVFQTIFKDAFSSPQNIQGNDDRNQLLSAFARWVFPESGFEVYGEYSREDHSANLRDLLVEPEHGRAYMLGFGKVAWAGSGLWSFRGEITQLERTRTYLFREAPVYYTHHLMEQGYSHRGQPLGGGIGPGSSSQFFGVDHYTPWGRLGGYIERIRYDDDFYHERPTDGFLAHNVELTAGVDAVGFIGNFDVYGSLALSRDLNRYYVYRNDHTNLRAGAGVKWRWALDGPLRLP